MSGPKHTPELRVIPGFDGYAAAADGSIWSIATNWRGYGPRKLIADRGTRKYPIPSRSDRRKEARAFARGELRRARKAVA